MITILIQFAISTAVGIAVALFVHWLTRNSTQKAVEMSFDKATNLIMRQDFLREAGIFKIAFNKTREIIIIDSNHSIHTLPNLWTQIPVIERAIVRFETYLPENLRTELRKAWDDYRRQDEASYYNEYFTEDQIQRGDFSNFKEKQLILGRIDNILHFTDPDFVYNS